MSDMPDISMFSSPTIVINGGTFTQHIKNTLRAWSTNENPFGRLQRATASNAFHNSGERRDPPKCHPNTRVAILKNIMDRIVAYDPLRDKLITWLYGPAGAGKSAIAQSIADLCHDQKLLLASFFFSRFDPDRNCARFLFATISYQVVEGLLGAARDSIMAKIDQDPLIFARSLEEQMDALVFYPLQPLLKSGYFGKANSKRLIIIDGLDECTDREEQVQILNTISNSLRKHNLPIFFLITSRPEHDIVGAFRSSPLQGMFSSLPLDDDYHSFDDIGRFMRDQVAEIKANHPLRAHIPCDWPSEKVIQEIVHKSSGQFIYASTVMKFISSSRHSPTNRLDILLGIRPANHDMPFAELDALYTRILSSIENPKPVLQILAFHILSPYKYTISDLERILSLDPGEVELLFCDMRSLITTRSKWSGPDDDELLLHIFHASLEDFLLDESRSGDFYIDTGSWCTQLARICIHYLTRETPDNFSMPRAMYLSNLRSYALRALPSAELRDDFITFIGSGLRTLFNWNDNHFHYIVDVCKKFNITTEEIHHIHGQNSDTA